ncbi:elongation factor [Thalictrum thalictroides]|uniref:Elongation factor n=1 Tax=Thalictrum thalictroides TaxID=46969 RepID=A0A7J6V4W1_THATH|nr:elongation factor [Thalictrum thalictroides]
MVGQVHHPLGMVETVLEVADVAWNAMEIRQRHQHQHQHHDDQSEIESLRVENCRLRKILEENLQLFQRLSDESPSLSSEDCPSDLSTRLAAAADSTAFLCQLQTLHEASMNESNNQFPFRKATETDLDSAEILVNVGLKEPSLWVWVTHEKVLPGAEEFSGIDDECYVIVNEELVVDSVANFIARCILSNPKSKCLTPEELQKTVAKALHSVNKLERMFSIWHAAKMFYVLATWGLTLAGLYRHRAFVQVAAKGIGHTGKIIMKAL